MTARMLKWSLVKSKTDPRAERFQGDVEQWRAAVSQVYGGTKDGPAFCGAVFAGDYRKRANVEGVDFLMLDFDDIEGNPMDVIGPISSYCFYAYSSYSHGIPDKCKPGAHRFRMLLPLAETISSDAYDLLWSRVNDMVGGVLDVGARDASRLNYLRRSKAPDSSAKPWAKFGNGEMLNPYDLNGWDAREAEAELLREKERNRQRAEARRKEMETMTDDEKWGWVDSALRHISAEDYDDWLKVGMALRDAQSDGFSDAFRAWEMWSSTSSKYKDGDCDEKWKTLDVGSTTLGTVWKMASDSGWSPPARTETGKGVAEMLQSWKDHGAIEVDNSGDAGSDNILVDPTDAPEDAGALLGTTDHYLAERALREMGFGHKRCAFTGNTWMRYDSRTGCFYESENAVYLIVHQVYHGMVIAGSEGDDGEVKRLITNHGLRSRVEATAQIVALDHSKGFFDTPRAGLCFTNGFYNAESGQLEPHSPDNRQTKNIGIEYDAEAKCPNWDANMLELFGGLQDGELKIQLVEEFLGVAMLGESTRLAKTLFMLGDGRNGKSTLIGVMSSIMPEDSVCNVSPHKLSGHQADYWMLKLRGKLLNVVPDLARRDLMDMGDWKAVVAGDQVSGRHPFGRPEEFIPRAGHVVLTNELPQVGDTSHGFWNRILALNFERTFNEQDRDLNRLEKLMRERSGIVTRLLRAGQRALERGRYVPVPSVDAVTREWQTESTPIKMFLMERIDDMNLDFEGRAAATDVYKLYREWCEDSGRRPMNATNFGRGMSSEGVDKRKSGVIKYYLNDWMRENDICLKNAEVPF